MAAPVSALQAALEQLRASRTLQLKLDRPVRAAVLALGRCLADERREDSYEYDVTLTDGAVRVTCRLAPDLNRHVHTNALRCGACVLLAQLSLVHDERRLGHSWVRVDAARCGPEDAAVLRSVTDLDSLRWWSRDDTGPCASSRADLPLQRSRKHYLPLWNNEDPHGAVWVPNTAPPDVVIDVSKLSLLGDLDAFFCSSRRPLPLLVRVLHKSRLRYYGKPGQNLDFPFQAYFEVADQTGVMSMVLWNDLCPEWYQRLAVGSVLHLQHYTLKRSYRNRSRPQLSYLPLLTFHTIEICLNPRNPSAVVTVIPPKSVQPQWSLPEVTFNFCTRSEVEGLASNQACDLIGLVIYVGRVERIRNKGNSIPEKFWTYRWIHAVDGTSDCPFILEIFASSQPEIFNNICPMTYLVCTQMRVCREAGSSLYLTSSAETQLFITGCHRKQPYVSDPKVKVFIQWTKTLKETTVLRKTRVGGHYCYPPPPPTYTPSTSSTPSRDCEAPLSLMAVADLQRELAGLHYREHRTVAIQGHIAAVQYHSWSQEAPQSGTNTAQHTPRKIQQVGSGSVGVARESVSASSTGLMEHAVMSAAPPGDSTASPKRRKIDQGTKQTRLADLQEDEDDESQYDDDDESGEGHSNLASVEQSPLTTDNRQTASTVALDPSASWESSVWALLKQNIVNHFRCGSLDRESMAEKFSFDDRDALLYRINLSPSSWSPDLPSDTILDTHTPVDASGYFTLTILGLNQQAAVNAVFVPVFSSDDPRAVGMPAPGLHDNTLMAFLSLGGICAQTTETLLSSAPALEGVKVVCVLDVCLLGPERVEIICSKIYQTAHISADVSPV
ncbi:RPA-related protein RADX isoform X1 [Electrophorus electricus]|nr:RPA-related protein RADX isoform X1 [Electrophorus electricus]